MLYHLITPIKVGDVFARALRIIYVINGVVPIPASHNYSGHTHIIITITIINDYCRENFVLKKIFQIREILNPRNFVPIRYIGFPDQLQTAYQKGVSCINATFATQEILINHLRDGGGSPTYVCLT